MTEQFSAIFNSVSWLISLIPLKFQLKVAGATGLFNGMWNAAVEFGVKIIERLILKKK